jgi:hypothetical protein
MVNYDLVITTGGALGFVVEDIVNVVAPAIGLYPGYNFQSVKIQGNVVHIYFSDNSTASSFRAEFLGVDDAIVLGIIAVLVVLGLVILTYELKQLVTTSPTLVYGGLAVAGAIALGYLIIALKRRNANTED